MTKAIVLETRGLAKRYRGVTILDNISLTIEKGEIYGFIGENGAGKTTFMRLISGLSYPSGGDFSLFGKTGDKELRQQRSRIGFMIESPALYGSMNAYQNLKIQCLQRGIKDGAKRIMDTLEIVGLPNTGKKTTRQFSLGMKQRLGIAVALIGNPDFLILDEPINGLDPSGVVEIRELIRRLNEEMGVTLLISSHILSELYQTATRYILLHKGHVLDELTLEQLGEQMKIHNESLEDYFLRRIGGN